MQYRSWPGRKVLRCMPCHASYIPEPPRWHIARRRLYQGGLRLGLAARLAISNCTYSQRHFISLSCEILEAADQLLHLLGRRRHCARRNARCGVLRVTRRACKAELADGTIKTTRCSLVGTVGLLERIGRPLRAVERLFPKLQKPGCKQAAGSLE